MIDEAAVEILNRILDIGSGSLPVEELTRIPTPQVRALLRCWISRMGYLLPDTVRLNRIINEVLSAGPDRNPMVHWPGVELRRYRGWLYLMPPLPHLDPDLLLEWKTGSQLRLPAGLGTLTLHEGAGGIAKDIWRSARVQVRFRQQGEKLKSMPGENSVSLKRFFQQRGIPPWQRSRTPLIYINDELVAVGDLFLCKPFQSNEDKSLNIAWDRVKKR